MDELVLAIAAAATRSPPPAPLPRSAVVGRVVVVVRPGGPDRVDQDLADRPTHDRLRSCPMPSWRSSKALSRSRLTSAGTSSARRLAGVPGRGENAAAKTASYRTTRSSSSVRWNWASVSPQKPTMTSVVRAMPGIAARSRSTRLRYASTVYWRPIRCSTASSPAWMGRCRCSQTDSHSAIASMSLLDRSQGWEVTNRSRGMVGRPSSRRMASMARRSAAMSGRPGRRGAPERAGRQDVTETWVGRQVVAVGVDVLAQQRHVQDARRGQRACLGHHVIERSAAFRPRLNGTMQ